MTDTQLLRALWHDMADRFDHPSEKVRAAAAEACTAIQGLLVDLSAEKVTIRPLTWRGVHGFLVERRAEPGFFPEERFCHDRPAAEATRRAMLAGVGNQPFFTGGAA